MAVRKAVIPAAGLGTRLLPLSAAGPKELLPLGTKPALHYAIEEAVEAGVEVVTIVSSRAKGGIADYFDPSEAFVGQIKKPEQRAVIEQIRELTSRVDIVVVRQKEALGLGHAVLTAAPVVGEDDFLVMLPDDVLFPAISLDMVRAHTATGCGVLTLRQVPEAAVSRYGIVGLDQGQTPWKVTEAVEKPDSKLAPSRYAIMGRYLLPARAMAYLRDEGTSVGGEIQLTPVLHKVALEQSMVGLDVTGHRYFDMGTMDGFRIANAVLALEDPRLGPVIRGLVQGNNPDD